MKPLSPIADSRMVKALAHPLRVRILAALENRTASPSELADELGVNLSLLSYHVRKLESLGLLKMVKQAQRRGAVEHFYRLEERPSATEEAWSAPDVVREAFLGAALGQVSEQVNAAAAAGGFDRQDAQVSRLPLALDDEGFAEAAGLVEELVERLKEVEDRSRKRLKKAADEQKTDGLAVLMLFEAA